MICEANGQISTQIQQQQQLSQNQDDSSHEYFCMSSAHSVSSGSSHGDSIESAEEDSTYDNMSQTQKETLLRAPKPWYVNFMIILCLFNWLKLLNTFRVQGETQWIQGDAAANWKIGPKCKFCLWKRSSSTRSLFQLWRSCGWQHQCCTLQFLHSCEWLIKQC